MSHGNPTLLVILNPRRLPECMLSLENIDAPKVWVKNYSERELEQILPRVFEDAQHDYDYFVVVSDDVIASTTAFTAVRFGLEVEKYQVVTGYCNLDPFCGLTSLTKSPPREPYLTEKTYDWISFRDLPSDPFIRTWHPSFAMTGMSSGMWKQYPWRCYGHHGNAGWGADLDLSIRLYQNRIPIYAARKGFMYHTKIDWRKVDHADHPERRGLYVGVEPPEIVWDT